ncbi:phage tail tape measure protein [Klebsiella pneumoniae]|uniref:tape measure protein n=1 Tax=Klebsiella pneumoniae TaxID=573 RepID=UPI00073BBC6A|nr:tape measure protein [Klebsiella pneumoniae]HDU2980896.1 tape measure protein [Klebsiella pneumoniae subsp. pneumoniae]EIW9105919.1 phage tail tape measure protein [Klebsiella pneumoniae]KSX31016.1 phage tail tape measure protein [Klebsiella pneumoniae]HBQ4436240.1 tape measure protein [Klebsiella pneumoniae]HBS2638809.1 tape measure protein [Klebsiella pneumoniae]
MAEKVGDLYYDVDIETAKLISGSRKASDVLGAMDKSARGASAGIDKLDNSGQKAAGSMDVLKSALSGVASAITVSLIIDYGKAFLEVADNVTQLQSRIARLSSGADEAKVTFSALAQIASNTGASLQNTQSLWEKLTSSLKGTGATNSQILFLTDTLQKIGRVGGSSAEEMATALRQFGQSIDGGVVRAEEFNSVVESMPELARQMAAGLGLSMGQLRQAMLDGKITAEVALNAIAKQSAVVNQEFNKLPRTMEQASNSLTVSLSLLVGKMNEATGASTTMVAIIDSISAAIDRLSGRTETAAQKIADLTSTAEMYSKRARTWSWLGLDGWSQQNKALSVLSTKAATLAGDLSAVGKASEDAANSQKGFGGVNAANPKQDNLIKISERRLALAKLEGEARARLQAQYDAADAGVTDPKRIKDLQDEYAETYRVTEARKESDKAGKQSASTADSIAQKLENLRQQSELAADSTQELSREQAILRAQQSLGKSATQAQIQEAGKYAAAAWDAAAAAKGVTEALNAIPEQAENKSYAESMQNLKAALNAGKIDLQEYNAATEQMEQQHQANLAKIRSQHVVNPTRQALAEVDPVQQLANQHAQELALIQQFEQQGVLAHENALALKNAADRQYEQQRIAAQWEILSQQSLGYNMLTSAVDAFSGNASNAITGLLTGTMSAQEAMQSLGNTILNSVINSIVQVGVEMLKNFIIGQTIGAASTANGMIQAALLTNAWTPAAYAASVATGGAAAKVGAVAYGSGLATSMALSTVSGARYNGGPVSAGGLYQVGEKGKPEIYQASTGKQYMIPGDNGKVIRNKDMQGGGLNVQVVINNQASNAEPQYMGATQNDGNYVLEFLISDAERNGPYISTLQSTLGLSRKANGAF